MSKDRFNITVQFVDAQGQLVSKAISFVSAGCTYFFNAQHLMLQLERGERALFDYLCQVMDSQNRIRFDQGMKKAFLDFVSEVSNKNITYKMSSLDQYIRRLSELNLVFLLGRDGSRGSYIVNPKYVYRGSDAARKTYLKELIEKRLAAELSIQPLLNETADVFLNKGQNTKQDSDTAAD